MKKTRNILVSLLTCLFVILAVPAAVSAAAKAPQCPKKQTLEFYNAYISGNEMPTEGDGYIYIKNLSRSAVITNVRSSLVDMGITPHTPTQNRTCAINAYGFSLYISYFIYKTNLP